MRYRAYKLLKKFFLTIFLGVALFMLGYSSSVKAKPPTKAKFYDFSEQIIDGEVKKPTNLYVDSRQKVRFDRLLKLKKSFIRDLMDTAKERVFK